MVRYEVNAVMLSIIKQSDPNSKMKLVTCFWQLCLKKGARAEAGKQKHHAKVGRKKSSNKREGQTHKKEPAECQSTNKPTNRHMARSLQKMNCYPKGCAAPGFVPCQCNTCRPLSKLERTLPQEKLM